jgi:hypothetical protein
VDDSSTENRTAMNDVKELLTKDKHSKKTEMLTDEQIDDLVEFVLSL